MEYVCEKCRQRSFVDGLSLTADGPRIPLRDSTEHALRCSIDRRHFTDKGTAIRTKDNVPFGRGTLEILHHCFILHCTLAACLQLDAIRMPLLGRLCHPPFSSQTPFEVSNLHTSNSVAMELATPEQSLRDPRARSVLNGLKGSAALEAPAMPPQPNSNPREQQFPTVLQLASRTSPRDAGTRSERADGHSIAIKPERRPEARPERDSSGWAGLDFDGRIFHVFHRP